MLQQNNYFYDPNCNLNYLSNCSPSSADSIGNEADEPVPEVQMDTVPEVPEVPEVPVPEALEVPEVPEALEVPEVPEALEVPEVPEVPGVPEVLEVPGVPEKLVCVLL